MQLTQTKISVVRFHSTAHILAGYRKRYLSLRINDGI